MIEGQITQLLCENVTLTDELSEYVVPVGDAQPVLTVLNEKGEDVTVTGITASFTNGKIQVDFPDDYKLQPGYIYKVNLNIEPSEAAYAYYSANNGYPTGVLGEENTGTHSMDKGFYSNKEAKVEYEFNGLKQTNMYPKPVVQLQTVNVTIKKEVAGNMADINESFLFSYQVNDGASEPISLSHKGEFTISAKKGSKILISEVPETGYETQITVVSGDANISNISGSYRTDKITQDTVIVFTNTKQVDVPTGIFSNQIPYLLMISIAAIGTTGFIYPVYRHKRHRRNK